MTNSPYHISFVREEDLDSSYLGWFEDEEVMGASSNGRFQVTRAGVEDFLQTIASRQRIAWAIREKGGGVVGTFSLQSISWPDSSAEFAVLIGNKEHWNKGLGKMALLRASNHAFNVLGLHRLSLGTPDFNRGMIRVAESAGFNREGLRRDAFWANGDWHDVVEFGLLKEQFETR